MNSVLLSVGWLQSFMYVLLCLPLFLSVDVASDLLYQAMHSPGQLLYALALPHALYFLNHYSLDMLT